MTFTPSTRHRTTQENCIPMSTRNTNPLADLVASWETEAKHRRRARRIDSVRQTILGMLAVTAMALAPAMCASASAGRFARGDLGVMAFLLALAALVGAAIVVSMFVAGKK